MTDILDLPGIRSRVSPISVKEYHRLGERNVNGRRTELIRGLILEKPARPPRYRLRAASFASFASTVLPDGFTVRVNDPLTFADSEPEPDLAIVRGSDEDFQEAHPSTAALVVEVTDGDAELERAMASMYAEAGVEEYWIDVIQKNAIEVYRRPVDGEYQEEMTVESGTVACACIPAFTICLGCWSA